MEDAPERRLVNRMIRASRFERPLYAEVAADITATRQAAIVIVIVGVASLISARIAPPDFSWLGVPADASAPLPIVLDLILTLMLAIVIWLAWAGIAWYVGMRLVDPDLRNVEFLQVARATGFAQAPGILTVAGFIPTLGVILQVGLYLWVLATTFVAIRESMRLTVGQAIATIAIGIAAFLIAGFVLGVLLVLATPGGP